MNQIFKLALKRSYIAFTIILILAVLGAPQLFGSIILTTTIISTVFFYTFIASAIIYLYTYLKENKKSK